MSIPMAKSKLFPPVTNKDDKRDPHQRFNDIGAKVFSVPKAEIDKREKQWRKNKSEKA